MAARPMSLFVETFGTSILLGSSSAVAPQGDAGLSGRKFIIDTYGGWGARGVVPSWARTPSKWTGPQHASTGRWEDPWSRVGSASVRSCKAGWFGLSCLRAKPTSGGTFGKTDDMTSENVGLLRAEQLGDVHKKEHCAKQFDHAKTLPIAGASPCSLVPVSPC